MQQYTLRAFFFLLATSSAISAVAQTMPPGAPNNLRVGAGGDSSGPTIRLGIVNNTTEPGSVVVRAELDYSGLTAPSPLAATKWSKASGPGSVTFTDDSVLTTTAAFSVDGAYTLRFEVNDGSAKITKDISLVVSRTQPANLPALALEPLGVPVRSSRYWSTALSPNNRGGFNFITQFWEYPTTLPTEYMVLDLERKVCTITKKGGAGYSYTNSNYQYTNQVRAANGRIFFAQYSGGITYYDPQTESIKDLGVVTTDPIVFKFFYAKDGFIYAGTQSGGLTLPSIIQIDPNTLTHRLLGRVGKNRLSYSYGYNLAVDPPWVYVGVGQNPWELAAINIQTGESKVLLERPAGSFIDFNTNAEGVVAKVITPEKSDWYWAIDGNLIPYVAGYDPKTLPFTPRSVSPLYYPVPNAPSLDLSKLTANANGRARVSWKATGSAEWQQSDCQVGNVVPVAIESLLALPDGTLLGNAKQYQGFFRYNPQSSFTFYGAPENPSGGPRLVVGDKAYISGYPSSGLYRYDLAAPWTGSGPHIVPPTTPINPVLLGYFRPFTDTHYAYHLALAANQRLYFSGRRERTGVGAGVGYYEIGTNTFTGHNTNLAQLDPSGLAVLESLSRVVFSGKFNLSPPAVAPAMLVLYDFNLNEIERLSPHSGMQAAGRLFKAKNPDQLIGLSANDRILYRYDFRKKKLIDYLLLGPNIGSATQRPSDGSLWLTIGSTLVKVDSATLEPQALGMLASKPTLIEWSNDRLYITMADPSGFDGTQLARVAVQ